MEGSTVVLWPGLEVDKRRLNKLVPQPDIGLGDAGIMYTIDAAYK